MPLVIVPVEAKLLGTREAVAELNRGGAAARRASATVERLRLRVIESAARRQRAAAGLERARSRAARAVAAARATARKRR